MRNPHAIELAADTRAVARVMYTQDAKERTWALARLRCYCELFAQHQSLRFSDASVSRMVNTVLAIQAEAIKEVTE